MGSKVTHLSAADWQVTVNVQSPWGVGVRGLAVGIDKETGNICSPFPPIWSSYSVSVCLPHLMQTRKDGEDITHIAKTLSTSSSLSVNGLIQLPLMKAKWVFCGCKVGTRLPNVGRFHSCLINVVNVVKTWNICLLDPIAPVTCCDGEREGERWKERWMNACVRGVCVFKVAAGMLCLSVCLCGSHHRGRLECDLDLLSKAITLHQGPPDLPDKCGHPFPESPFIVGGHKQTCTRTHVHSRTHTYPGTSKQLAQFCLSFSLYPPPSITATHKWQEVLFSNSPCIM